MAATTTMNKGYSALTDITILVGSLTLVWLSTWMVGSFASYSVGWWVGTVVVSAVAAVNVVFCVTGFGMSTRP